MNSREKKNQLQKLINEQLFPLITSDYWLLNVPYHPNVGDSLIWQGELDFLKNVLYTCKGMCSYNSPVPTNIKESDLILIHGGGNFGDLWELPQEWQMNVVEMYPNNKIIFLPQTVWFEHEENMKACAVAFSQHKNLTICARDKVSYSILKENFKNEILLVPDMAFCIDMKKWKRYSATKEALLLKREDKEFKQTKDIEQISLSSDTTITDWPTFTEDCWQKTWFRRIKKYLPRMYDWYARYIFRPYLINSGIKLIDTHKKIYSTRLHAAIMSILLGKASDLVWYDNSYGKNKNFYDTWLKDCDGIKFIDNK